MTILQQMEIDRLTQERDERELYLLTEAFGQALGEAVATILATLPFDEWPTIGRAAFQHLQNQMPTAAGIYKERLPTENRP